jgi:hypothetical protein
LVCAPVVAVSLLLAAGPATAGTGSRLQTNGLWLGLGRICSSGSVSGTTARGVSAKSINVATFGDAGNTVEPGLNIEFFQAAKAFAAWCNASGGINGRKIIVDTRDAALFNSAQVTDQACQQDFMSVGGGMALDQPAVPVRVNCGLGQISGFVVSSQAVSAPLQVNPTGTNNTLIEAGWYGALARKYPQAIKHYGTGSLNTPSALAPYEKWRDAALQQGYKLVNWQLVPLSVPDWTPYVEQSQTKGVEALQPPAPPVITPYLQAMTTAGYKPAFMLLTPQYYQSSTLRAAAQSHLPPTYVVLQTWPFELASQSPGLQQLQQIMKRYSSTSPVDFDDVTAFDSWVLFAKSATACGSKLTVSCVLSTAASQRNWTGGGLAAPVSQLGLSNANPTPSDCFALMQVESGHFVYAKAVTKPNTQIWQCSRKTLFRVPANG